ncbi:MAG: tagaturonate epimerase family protein [Planctomycetaceae bacterium]|nr:tagaturonate epimerase family protein [Planctomycetaceae bacterium]
MMQLPKYSMGVGDRFAHEGEAQLDAVLQAQREGVEIAPVWNKSHREHTIVGSRPADVRAEADRAVAARHWKLPYFVDADHISLKTVDGFLEASDFFTLDVADWIGRDAGDAAIEAFVGRHESLIGSLTIAGIERPVTISRPMIVEAARKFLAAIHEAGEIHRRIEAVKGDRAVIEVSLDETDRPQTPLELLMILSMVSEENIPAQTIAPRFAGRFNKGVEYVGDPAEFGRQFHDDLAVVAFAVERFALPKNLKLSVHSGSDKFAIYGPMREAMRQFGAGVHLKTAGTTWLEELIGLAAAGDEGLQIAKDVYRGAFGRFDELCAPYATVIDIERAKLPAPDVVDRWNGETFAAALRHDASCPTYDPNVRQLLHVGYKVAAEMGRRFTDALEQHAKVVGDHVTQNLYERHIRPLFLGK